MLFPQGKLELIKVHPRFSKKLTPYSPRPKPRSREIKLLSLIAYQRKP
jgi:hypothetical protein